MYFFPSRTSRWHCLHMTDTRAGSICEMLHRARAIREHFPKSLHPSEFPPIIRWRDFEGMIEVLAECGRRSET